MGAPGIPQVVHRGGKHGLNLLRRFVEITRRHKVGRFLFQVGATGNYSQQQHRSQTRYSCLYIFHNCTLGYVLKGDLGSEGEGLARGIRTEINAQAGIVGAKRAYLRIVAGVVGDGEQVVAAGIDP